MVAELAVCFCGRWNAAAAIVTAAVVATVAACLQESGLLDSPSRLVRLSLEFR